jgi:hypothetical protein
VQTCGAGSARELRVGLVFSPCSFERSRRQRREKRSMYFIVYQDADGEWRLSLQVGDAREIQRGRYTFADRSRCVEDALTFRQSLAHALIRDEEKIRKRRETYVLELNDQPLAVMRLAHEG